jgi:hypothetical protein
MSAKWKLISSMTVLSGLALILARRRRERVRGV